MGVKHSVSLQAEGGVPPYTWSITDGQLPAGLTLDGSTIAGMATAPGTSNLIFKVTDANGAEATPPLDLTIDPPPSPGRLTSIQYRTNFADPRSNQLGPLFRISNTATGEVPLSELTLRYYFTVEDPKPLNYWCDWAMAGCDNIRGNLSTSAAASSTSNSPSKSPPESSAPATTAAKSKAASPKKTGPSSTSPTTTPSTPQRMPTLTGTESPSTATASSV